MRRLLVLLFWMTMTTWLLREEVMPERFGRTVHGYRSLIGDQLERESWMRIVIDGSAAGYSHTAIETLGKDPTSFSRIRHELRARLSLLGSSQDIQSSLVITLDAWNRMQEFTFALDSDAGAIHARGHRRERDLFKIIARTGAGSRQFEIQIPDDVILSSPMDMPALLHLRPGQSLTLKTLDPSSFTSAPVTIEALRTESLSYNGETIKTTVLRSTMLGMQSLSWMNSDGVVLRTETPFGWIFEAVDANEAFAALRQGRRESGLRQDVPAVEELRKNSPPIPVLEPSNRKSKERSQ